MYCGHARLCVCVCLSVCLSAAACPHYYTDPDVRGCPLVVHYWADLQSAHGLRCYGSIMRTRNVSQYMLVLALCLVCDSDGDTPTLLWELLYADDLIVIAESEEELD